MLVNHEIIDMSDFPQVHHSVNASNTSESVYVRYMNSDNSNSITVRFSNHENNAVKFGDQLDGLTATKNEVLAHLGLKKRVFVPKTKISVGAYKVKRSTTHLYEEAALTMSEIYELGVGADISMYKGMVTKGGNWIISGDTVEEVIETTLNTFGKVIQVGEYIYEN